MKFTVATLYRGPTETRGSRIRCKVSGAPARFIAYDHAAAWPHRTAAAEYLASLWKRPAAELEPLLIPLVPAEDVGCLFYFEGRAPHGI